MAVMIELPHAPVAREAMFRPDRLEHRRLAVHAFSVAVAVVSIRSDRGGIDSTRVAILWSIRVCSERGGAFRRRRRRRRSPRLGKKVLPHHHHRRRRFVVRKRAQRRHHEAWVCKRGREIRQSVDDDRAEEHRLLRRGRERHRRRR